MLSVLHSSFAGNDEDRDATGVTQGSQTLAELESRVLRHHQIKQNGIRSVFKRQRKRLFRIACIDDFECIGQPHSKQSAYGFVVIHDQNLRHSSSSSRIESREPCRSDTGALIVENLADLLG